MEMVPEVGVAVEKLLFRLFSGVTDSWQLVTPRWQVGERWVTVVRHKGIEGFQGVESTTEFQFSVTGPDVSASLL